MLIQFENSALLKQSLNKIRDKYTSSPEFRKNLRRIGRYLAYEAAKNFPKSEVIIETPLQSMVGYGIAKKVVVISVLRAALPMVDAIFEEFDSASLGVVSASRGSMKNDKGTEFEIIADYFKIPPLEDKIVLIVDPMLATGSTILYLLKQVVPENPSKIVLISAIASRYAIDLLEKNYPDIEIYTGSIDPILNQNGYIVPGLGDAGDRACNTEH